MWNIGHRLNKKTRKKQAKSRKTWSIVNNKKRKLQQTQYETIVNEIEKNKLYKGEIEKVAH